MIVSSTLTSNVKEVIPVLFVLVYVLVVLHCVVAHKATCQVLAERYAGAPPAPALGPLVAFDEHDQDTPAMPDTYSRAMIVPPTTKQHNVESCGGMVGTTPLRYLYELKKVVNNMPHLGRFPPCVESLKVRERPRCLLGPWCQWVPCAQDVLEFVTRDPVIVQLVLCRFRIRVESKYLPKDDRTYSPKSDM